MGEIGRSSQVCAWHQDGLTVGRNITLNLTSSPFRYGGGIEYFNRSSMSRKRRQKANPVTGEISETPLSWGI
jgi:hypothetical protein